MTGRSISLGRLAPAVVLMLVLGGCGGSAASQAPGGATQPPAPGVGGPTTAPAGPGIADACTLLTTAEVSAAGGSTFTVATPSSDANYLNCAYTSADASSKLSTFVARSAATSGYWATVKVNKGSAVSGVGDEAFWSTDSFMPGLYFLKGGVLAYISGSSDGPDDLIIGLGKLMAGRM
jgi:hypothetical protein